MVSGRTLGFGMLVMIVIAIVTIFLLIPGLFGEKGALTGVQKAFNEFKKTAAGIPGRIFKIGTPTLTEEVLDAEASLSIPEFEEACSNEIIAFDALSKSQIPLDEEGNPVDVFCFWDLNVGEDTSPEENELNPPRWKGNGIPDDDRDIQQCEFIETFITSKTAELTLITPEGLESSDEFIINVALSCLTIDDFKNVGTIQTGTINTITVPATAVIRSSRIHIAPIEETSGIFIDVGNDGLIDYSTPVGQTFTSIRTISLQDPLNNWLEENRETCVATCEIPLKWEIREGSIEIASAYIPYSIGLVLET
jgi:hypothetical protein